MTTTQATLFFDDLRAHLQEFKDAYEAYKEEVRAASSAALADIEGLERDMDAEVERLEDAVSEDALEEVRARISGL